MANPHRIDENENIIKEAVRAELQSLEIAPPPEAWGKIASRLDFSEESVPRAKKNPVPWYRSLGFAASLLLLMGIGSSLYFSQIFTPFTQNDASPGSLDMMMDSGSEEELGILSGITTESFDEGERSSISSGSVPDVLGEFKLMQVTESPGPLHAVYYLYAQEDRELWFVSAGSIDMVTVDFPGVEDGRFISSHHINKLDKDRGTLIRDNIGKPVLVWFYSDAVFLLWARSDDIRGKELLRLRSYWP